MVLEEALMKNVQVLTRIEGALQQIIDLLKNDSLTKWSEDSDSLIAVPENSATDTPATEEVSGHPVQEHLDTLSKEGFIEYVMEKGGVNSKVAGKAWSVLHGESCKGYLREHGQRLRVGKNRELYRANLSRIVKMGVLKPNCFWHYGPGTHELLKRVFG